MKYEVVIVNDSSAGEITEASYRQPYNINTYRNLIETHKSFPEVKPPICVKLYEEEEFNSLNDFVHCIQDFIINDKVKLILEGHKLPIHEFVPAEVHRIEEKFLFIKKNAKYKNYFWFNVDCEIISDYYNYIDFSKSDIVFTKNNSSIGLKIETISDLLGIKKSNQKISSRINEIYKQYPKDEVKRDEIKKEEDLYGISWRAEKLVMNDRFDKELDLFSLPIFSSQTYISQRLKHALLEQNVTGISFKETGINRDGRFPLNPMLEVTSK